MQTVVDEIYGGIWASPPLPIGDEDWSLAWVAVLETRIIGPVLTNEDWISDLWVLGEHRGHGVGRQLLLRGEAEIAGRGHQAFRLRVVKSNLRAIAFYNRMGWRVAREFPHEKFPVAMLEMTKTNRFGATYSLAYLDRDETFSRRWNIFRLMSGQNSLSTCETASVPTCSKSLTAFSPGARLSG